MPINSRNKGSRAERLVCELLLKWTGRKFAKVPASGGLHWNISQACGDVICLSENHKFPFAVEVKNYNGINFSHLLIKGAKAKKNERLPEILEFWDQCVRDSKEAKKIPFLMMRYDNLPRDFFFIVLDLNFWYRATCVLRLPNLWGTKIYQLDKLYYRSRKKKYGLIILRSDEFFRIPYKTLKKALQHEDFKRK